MSAAKVWCRKGTWGSAGKWVELVSKGGGSNAGAPQRAGLANQIPLLGLRLDYFNIGSRRKFHWTFSSFLLQIKKYTRGCHDRRLASYSGALPFFLYGEYLGD